jgi:tetratricopeptide (TPR) repeat protein
MRFPADPPSFRRLLNLGTRAWVLVGVSGILIILALSPLRDAWAINDAGILINRILAAETGDVRPADARAVQEDMAILAAAGACEPHTDARETPIWRTYGTAAALVPSDDAYDLLLRAADMGYLDRWGRWWLGEVASATGNWDEARKAYQRVDASNLLLSRADAYLESGRPELAIRQYDLAEASLDAAVAREAAEGLLDRNDASVGSPVVFSAERVTALLRIGRGLLSANQPDQAVPVLEEALQKSETASPGAMVEQSLNLSLALALAQMLPDQPDSAVAGADSSHSAEDRRAALTRIRALVDEAVKSDLTGSVCVQASRVFRLTGDVARSLTMLSQAIEIDPLLPDAYLALGTWYESQGMNMSARNIYQKATELLPANLEIAVAYAIASYKSVPPEEALPLLKQTSETETDDPYLFAFLGDCYLDLGQVTMARLAYEEGLRRAPQAEPLASRRDSLEETTEACP